MHRNPFTYSAPRILSTGRILILGSFLLAVCWLTGGVVVAEANEWTTRTAAGDNDGWNSIAYGNGTFVAVSYAGDRVMTSPDGITWTARAPLGNNDGWLGVTYGAGLFVAVGAGGDYVMTSADNGATWSVATAAQNNTWRDVTYSEELGLFVAVAFSGTDRVMTSINGTTWTARSTPGDSDAWEAVTYGNGTFVALACGKTGTSCNTTAGDGNRVMTSPDGITWTLQSTGLGDDQWQSVVYGNGMFVGIADSGSDDVIATSPDGITWTSRTVSGTSALHDVAFGSGKFVAVGYCEGGLFTCTAESTDGVNWVAILPPVADGGWIAVGYGEDTFVAVNYGFGTTTGAMTLPATTSLDQSAFRFVTDDGSESGSSFAMSLNNDIVWGVNTPVRFRAQIDSSLPTTSRNHYYLQYKATTSNYWHTVGVDDEAPQIVATSSGRSTGALSIHPVSIPAGNVEDLLLVIFSNDNDVLSTSTSPGWYKFGEDTQHNVNNANYTNVSQSVFWKRATTTTSETLNITIPPGGEEASYVVYRISGAGTPVFDSTRSGGGNTPVPSLTTDAVRSYLWIAGRSHNGQANATVAPTGFGQMISIRANTTAGASTDTAIKYERATTTSPGTFTNPSGQTIGTLIAVPPRETPSVGNVFMADDDRVPTAVNDTGIGTLAWGSVGNITASDNAQVSRIMSGTAVTNYIKATGFGFSIPVEAEIVGIEAWWEKSYGVGTTGYVVDDEVVLVKTGSVIGNDKSEADAWATTGMISTYGGPSDLWGTTWTPADINDPDFGTALAARGAVAGTDGTARVDYVEMKVYYRLSPDIILATSTYIGAGGANTTGRLTPPSGKTLGDFDAGRIQDDENPTDQINISANDYTEVEWAIMATGTATTSDVYALRVALGPNATLTSYTNEASLTIGTYVADPPDSINDTVLLSGSLLASDMVTPLTATRTIAALVHDTGETSTTSVIDGEWSLSIEANPYGDAYWTASDVLDNNDEWNSLTYGEGLFVAVGDCAGGDHCVMTSPDGVTWTARTPAESNEWMSVTYGEGLFVAVAISGTNRVMTSPDGIAWTARSVPVRGWRQVTYGNGRFVVVGESGRYMYSNNGTTGWSEGVSPEANSWEGLTYGKGLFVAVAREGTNRVMTSSDGSTWTMRSAAAVKLWRRVVYGNGRFVASASDVTDNFMHSDDGINWSLATDNTSSGSWFGLTYGNGRFVAVSETPGFYGDPILISTDGIVWQPQVVSTTTLYSRVGYGSGRFVALADAGSLATSSDGILVSDASYSPVLTATIWVDGDPEVSGVTVLQTNRGTTSVSGITLVRDQVRLRDTAFIEKPIDLYTLAQADNVQDPELPFIASTTLDTLSLFAGIDFWIEPNASFVTPRTVALQGSLSNEGVLYSDPTDTLLLTGEGSALTGTFYGTSTLGRVVASSTIFRNDAVTWTAASAAQANEWRAVAYGNGLFVAVSADGTNHVMTSPDGITWTARSAAGDDDLWTDVIYAGGQFVAVGDGSGAGTDRVMTSPDGITWTPRTAAGTGAWQSVAYGNGVYVATAVGGDRVMSSPDGITWTLRTVPLAVQLYNVTFGNGRFVAQADATNGSVVSFDGKNWEDYPILGTSDDWMAITYGAGVFVGVGDCAVGNCIATSPDGITWTARTSPTSAAWDAIAYGNGLFVAIARNSTAIITSPDGITWTALTNTAANSWSDIIYGDGRYVAVSRTGTNRVAVSTTGTTTPGVVSFATTTALTDLTIATGTAVATEPLWVAGSYENRGTAYLTGTTTFTTSAAAFTISSSTVLTDESTTFSVAEADTLPQDIVFRPDGLELYLVGGITDKIFSYTLSVPWDLSTATLNGYSLFIGDQETTPRSLQFSADGTQLFFAGIVNDTIYRYTLTTPWDLTTATDSGVSFSIGVQEGSMQVMRFSPSGTKLYIFGNGGFDVTQYTLTTPWDLTTAAHNGQALKSAADELAPQGIIFHPDGQLLYLIGSDQNRFDGYTLTTPWDTLTATSTGSAFFVIDFETNSQPAQFSADGRFLYHLGQESDDITIYPLRVADQSIRGTLIGDSAFTKLEHSGESTLTVTEPLEAVNLSVTNASGTVRVADGVPLVTREGIVNMGTLEAPTSPVIFGSSTGFYVTGGTTLGSPFSVSGQDSTPYGIHIKPDGTKLYMLGQGNDRVYSYTLTTPWDMGTAVYDGDFTTVKDGELNPRDVSLSVDGTRMFILGATEQAVTSYTLRVPWDITTAQYDGYDVSHTAQDTSMYGMSFKPDGAAMYLVGTGNDRVYQYALSRPWDLRSAVATGGTALISGQTFSPRGLQVTADGQHAYVTGDTDIHYYTFTTPWDISSLSYQATLSVSGADIQPRNLAVDPTGTKLYLVGGAGDHIITYRLPEQAQTIRTIDGGNIRFGNTTIASATTTTFSGSVTTLDLTVATSATLAAPGTLTIGGQYINNGTTDYVGGTQVFQPLFGSYTMVDATLTLVDELDFDTAGVSETNSGQKFQFSADGTYLYQLVNTSDYIRQYTLETPWYPSTAVEQPVTFSTLGVDSDAQDFIFRPDGRRLYIIGQGDDILAQFTVAEPWNVSTAQLQDTISIAASAADSQAIIFRPDGTYMYILNSSTGDDTVVEYVMSESWNAHTASSTGVSLSVGTQDSTARGIRFSTNGRHLYLKGIVNDDLFRYDLSTPWDLTTAVVASGVHDTTTYDSTPQGIMLLADQTAYFSHGNGASGNTIARYDVVRDTQVATGTLTGTSAFHNLTIENGAAGTATSGVAFAAPVETTGTFTLQPNSYTTLLANATNTFAAINWDGDDPSTRAELESSEAGASTTVVAATYVTVANLSVRDINNAATDPILCIDNCIDGGNNTNWLFEVPPVTLTQRAFRFVSDTAGESTAPFLMSENTSITWASSSPLRFRAQVDNTIENTTTGFALQYKPSNNTLWHTLGVDDTFPTIVATSSGRSTGNTTSHPITLPSGNPGDLLIVIMGIDEHNRSATVPSEWIPLHSITRTASLSTEMFYTFATTTSQTLTVTLEQTQEASYVVYRIAGAGTPVADAFYADATNSNPPLVTVDGERPHLLIAARVANGQNLSSARPTGYQDVIQINANTTNGASTEAAHRFAIVDSEDPANFTSTNVRNHAITVMVPPVYTPSVDQLYVAIADSPGTAANDTSFGSQAWTTPSNALGSDNSRAYFTAAGTTASNYLKLTNFGVSIPSEATITGVELWTEHTITSGTTGAIRDNQVRLVKNNTVTGTDQAISDYWTFEDEETVYGGPTNLWGTTLTPADVNATDFGFVLSAKGTSATANRRGNMDNVRAYVYYTLPPPLALASSTYIGDGGESTTARLTPPDGKFFFDFTPGRIQDDENPADSVTFPVDTFTEYEWALTATGTAFAGETYDVRVITSPGLDELAYEHDAQVTIGSYVADGQLWNSADWTARDILVIDPANIDATLTDFPVYVDLADLSADFWAGVASDCGDIRITNAAGVELPREVVACDTASDTGEVHFRADTISATVPTSFSIYYNGSAKDYLDTQTYGTHNVWSNGYYLVQHLNEGDSTVSDFYRDSTASGLHGTLTDADGDSVNVSAGRVGNAFNFNGDADSINISNFYVTSTGTISTWLKRDEIDAERILGTTDAYELRTGGFAVGEVVDKIFVDSYVTEASGPSTGPTVTDTNRWYYVSSTYDEPNDVSTVYLDGQFAASKAHNTASAGAETNLTLGKRFDLANFYSGSLDEVRISNVIRSAAWIKAEYYNQATTTDFYSLGATATATLAAHSDGRLTNVFSFQNKTDEPVYSFRLTPSAAVTVDQLAVAVTGIKGIESGELADFRLYRDTNSDNALDGGDVQVGGAGVFMHSGQTGTVTFNTDFTLSSATNFIMTADLTSVDTNDVMVFGLRPTSVVATDDQFSLPVRVSGTVATVQHTRSTKGSGGGGGSVPDSVGGEAPEGDGDVGGGAGGGGAEIGQVPDGENISENPNFFRPSGQSGSWTDGANALISDGVRATAPGSVSHVFSNFGLTIPGGNTIVGIEVKLDSRFSSGGGTISVDLSGNSGSNYTTEKATPSLTASDVVYTLGAPADAWGKLWSPSEFSDGTFRLRVTSSAANLQLDGIEVRVYHQSTGGGGGGGGAI